MIKFFRKIRHKLISGNLSGRQADKLSRYLFYAIGEIVLVVIGILIAVSINDWNNDRKQKAEIHQLLMAFEKDLITNIEDATQVLNVSRRKDSLIMMVLNNQVTKEDYENKRLASIILSYNRITTTQENLIKLLNREEQMSSELQPLLKSLKRYQSLIDLYSHQQERLSNYVATQTAFFTENMEWFSTYMQSGDERAVAYFLNDPIYKNKVSHYQVMLTRNYAPSIAEYRNRAISLLYALQPYLGVHGNHESALKSIGLGSLRNQGCFDEIILDADSIAYFAPVIINASNDTLEIHLNYFIQYNRGETIMTLPPNQQLDGDFFAPHYFEIKKDGECLSKFKGGQDYLILNQNLVE